MFFSYQKFLEKFRFVIVLELFVFVGFSNIFSDIFVPDRGKSCSIRHDKSFIYSRVSRDFLL